MKKKTAILLHDIRSTHNVGSIFRTADTMGVSKIYISGYTPIPLDKYGRWRKDIAKVALGAEKIVVWERVKSPVNLIKKLKREKYHVISFEQSKNSIDYKKVKVRYPVLFIVGNEFSGVDSKILALSDIVAEIKMMGKKVIVVGRIMSLRPHGKIAFADVIDRSGTLQVVGGTDLATLKPQYAVSLEGTVNKRPEKMVNDKIGKPNNVWIKQI